MLRFGHEVKKWAWREVSYRCQEMGMDYDELGVGEVVTAAVVRAWSLLAYAGAVGFVFLTATLAPAEAPRLFITVVAGVLGALLCVWAGDLLLAEARKLGK